MARRDMLANINCKDERHHPLRGAHPTHGAAGRWLNPIANAPLKKREVE